MRTSSCDVPMGTESPALCLFHLCGRPNKSTTYKQEAKQQVFFQEAGNKGLNTKVSGDPLTVIVRLKSSYKTERIVKSLNKGKETKVWILKAIVLCKFFFEVIE